MAVKEKRRLAPGIAKDEGDPGAVREAKKKARIHPFPREERGEGVPEAVLAKSADDRRAHPHAGEDRGHVCRGAAEFAPKDPRLGLEDVPKNFAESDDVQTHESA